MNRLAPAVTAVLALTLGACNQMTGDATSSSSSSSSSESSAYVIQETHNVSYQGTVQKAEASIYMQGTHRLELADGRFVLIESADLDLDRYVGKIVAVLGSVRPTVEGDASLLRVEQITLLQQDSSSSETASSEAMSEESSSAQASSVAANAAPVASAAPVSSKAAASSIAAATVSSAAPAVASSAAAVSSAPALTLNGELDAIVAAMAKANLADAQWTQKYCSTHIGFCFPVHKNWYFNSFGTTTSYLWHVEIGNSEITDLGQGPLVVNLMSGGLAAAGKTDGAVEAMGDFVVGYKAFNETSHFEVSAPKALQASVQYITTRIQAQ